MLHATSAVTVAVDFLYTEGQTNVPAANDYLRVASRRMAPTASLNLVKNSGSSTMVPFPDAKRVEQKVEMTLHRADTQPFEKTIVVEARRLNDISYMTGVSDTIFQQGEEKMRHPNRIIFEGLAAANSEVFTHTKQDKTAKFPMIGIDGQPLLSTSHPQVGGGTVSNYVTSGGGDRWYLIAKGSRMPLQFLIADDYDMNEDPDSFHESRTYRYRSFAQVGVGVGDWRTIYSSNETFDTTSLNAAIAAMAAFRDDHGDKMGTIPGLVVAPYSLRGVVKATLATQFTTDLQTNYNAGDIEHLITPWL